MKNARQWRTPCRSAVNVVSGTIPLLLIADRCEPLTLHALCVATDFTFEYRSLPVFKAVDASAGMSSVTLFRDKFDGSLG